MKLAVLVSGVGTNLQALLDAELRGALAPGVIDVVVSNNSDAPALARATAAGKRAIAVDHRGQSREAFEDRLLAALDGIDAVVLAGFMRVLTARFLDRFPLRVINTHPSLLPAFPGRDAAAQAIAYGAKVSGVTIHFVDAAVDSGPIIAQAGVPILADDDAASLQARIQLEEHRLLPEIVQRVAAGTVICNGRRVSFA